jgi:tRNA pseudouridine55 synthase
VRGRDSGLDGILLVDKPAGWTSHDVVAKLRRLTGQRRIGHTGTLDPAATGLLVLCLGRATRLVEYFTQHGKSYEGEITLGTTTTTDDAEGDVLVRGEPPFLDDAALRALERRFTGQIDQRPPAFSAVKVRGERAYAMARRGDAPELASRRVTVAGLWLEPRGSGRLGLFLECGPGTYVRSLARDIGEDLGCGAHLAWLRRTRSGPFRVEAALPLAALVGMSAEAVAACLLPPDEGLLAWPAAVLSIARGGGLAGGRALRAEAAGTEARVRVYDAAGEFLATARLEGGWLRPVKVIARDLHSPRG